MTNLPGNGATTAGKAPTKRIPVLSVTRARTILMRLREEAGRLVAFSESKLLVREAASTIERLESEVARLQADLTRVTKDLERERSLAHAPGPR